MSRSWQLHDAKNRLSEVLEKASSDGPQTITVRGKPAAVVLSIEEYQVLAQPAVSLVAFLRQSPLHGVELDEDRSQDTGRPVEL